MADFYSENRYITKSFNSHDEACTFFNYTKTALEVEGFVVEDFVKEDPDNWNLPTINEVNGEYMVYIDATKLEGTDPMDAVFKMDE